MAVVARICFGIFVPAGVKNRGILSAEFEDYISGSPGRQADNTGSLVRFRLSGLHFIGDVKVVIVYVSIINYARLG
jgi:hypothetical protein